MNVAIKIVLFAGCALLIWFIGLRKTAYYYTGIEVGDVHVKEDRLIVVARITYFCWSGTVLQKALGILSGYEGTSGISGIARHDVMLWDIEKKSIDRFEFKDSFFGPHGGTELGELTFAARRGAGLDGALQWFKPNFKEMPASQTLWIEANPEIAFAPNDWHTYDWNRIKRNNDILEDEIVIPDLNTVLNITKIYRGRDYPQNISVTISWDAAKPVTLIDMATGLVNIRPHELAEMVGDSLEVEGFTSDSLKNYLKN